MNKSDFLTKLSKLLHMLKDTEVRDILDEYEQHIDMKVAEGMTEEDAIAAFGTVEELAEEILDAYHVKADFKENKLADSLGKVQTESKKVIRNAGEAGKGLLGNAFLFLKKAGHKTVDLIKRAYSFCKRLLMAPFVFLKKTFAKKKEEKSIRNIDKGEKRGWNIGSLIRKLCKGTWRLFKKFCYSLLFFISGIVGAGLLLFLGLLLVLMILGYPVVGITLISLGCTMSLGSVTYFAGKRWRKI